MKIVGIAEIINQIIPVLIAVIVAGFFIWRFLVKKGIVKFRHKNEDGIDITKAKRRSVDELNVVNEFKENFVITEDKTSFTTGVKCIGVSLDKLAEVERYLVAESHVGFYTMLSWQMQLYIQSRQMNVESNIEFIEETRKKVEDFLKGIDNKISNIEKIVEGAPERVEEFREQLGELQRLHECYSKMLSRKEEGLKYAKIVSSPDSPQQFDVYILYAYKHDPSAFTTDLSYEEIFAKAKQDMETKISSTISAMKKCMVECEALKPAELAEVLYRAYNLSDADIISFESLLQTSAFDLFTTTDYYKRVIPKSSVRAGEVA